MVTTLKSHFQFLLPDRLEQIAQHIRCRLSRQFCVQYIRFFPQNQWYLIYKIIACRSCL